MNSASTIAHALAGRRVQRLADGGYLIPCPVPSHGKGRGDRNPSLRIADGDECLLAHCFANCDPRDVLDELRRRGLLDDQDVGRNRSTLTPSKRPTPASRDDYAKQQHEKAAWLWSKRQPIGGTIAETYLRKARGIACPLPPTLGFLPPFKPEHSPALIAAFALPDEVEPGILASPRNVTAVHLTLLRSDGSDKADVPRSKLMVGSAGALPIVLAPVNDLCGLAITEGIEDALSAHQALGISAWAAGCASRMPKMADAAPSYVECITVLVDDDAAGRRGAEALARLLTSRGIETRLANIAQLSRGAP